jgi:hypothetical protein
MSSPQLDHVIDSQVTLTGGGHNAIRFVGELHLALRQNKQDKRLNFVVDTAAKVTLIPIALVQKCELLQVHNGNPSSLYPRANSAAVLLYKFKVAGGTRLHDLWFECECQLTPQPLTAVRLAFGSLFDYFEPSIQLSPLGIGLRRRQLSIHPVRSPSQLWGP